ncbi:glucarate dehydratase family protein [Nonomuraea typhae]|uniref:glucarate dehydratase n=1 Tax=Nonomuraea typhae TaxID=2603600 RepID=A0ABW7YRK4_9ACTN
MIIREIRVTPVAFRDPPLLNAAGVHEPWALRTIVEVVAEDGLTGLGETYGDLGHLEKVRECAQALVGMDVHHTNRVYSRISSLVGDVVSDLHGLTGMSTKEKSIDRVYSPFEVAFLDIRGKAANVPVCDLLGGRVRDAVPYSAYLFYKWAAHPNGEPDRFGTALDPTGLVDQAALLIKEYGFRSIKLKGGVFPPEQEMAAIHALHEAFPGVPLRLDPNTAWTPETSIQVAEELGDVLQYLEDPCPEIPGMAETAQSLKSRNITTKLATNMCVVTPEHLPPAIASDAIQVLLLDHHYWGGLARSAQVAALCGTFGLDLSMHSNSHLGISLAAMTHLAAATPNLTYACDTHTPWQDGQDVVSPGTLRFVDGAVPVPSGAGLGVELDRDALAVMHEQYLRCGITSRDDTGYIRRFEPDFTVKRATW